MYKYDHLREHGLANFELLLDFWGIEFNRVNALEYDLIAKWREDGNFGAVRFNTFKGRGSDFAGLSIAKLNYAMLGNGFGAEDFAGVVSDTNTNTGFDVIGLCQKVYNIDTYRNAAGQLFTDLQTISKTKNLTKPAIDAANARREKLEALNKSRMEHAARMWEFCKRIPFEHSLADTYLIRRGLPFVYLRETNVRYHPKVKNVETNKVMPAVLFKVTLQPGTQLVAIHRIYITDDGMDKADVKNPKMALATIQGAGIWFGNPGPRLAVAEGPENALSLRELGATFAVSTINATNFANLIIPDYVEHVVLYPDPDAAGQLAAAKALKNYSAQGKKISVEYPPTRKNTKPMDWNDLLQEAT